jgi:hypothetical protein
MKDGVRPVGHDGWMEATVVSNNDPLGEGRVACVIPKVNPGSDPEATSLKKSPVALKPDIFANATPPTTGSTATTTNATWLRPAFQVFAKDKKAAGGSYVVPTVGSKVEAFFVDEDPQKGYYRPATLTKPGDVIPGKNIPGAAKGHWGDKSKRPDVLILLESVFGSIVGLDAGGTGQAFMALAEDQYLDFSEGVVTVKSTKQALLTLGDSDHVEVVPGVITAKTQKVDLGGGAHEHLVLGDSFKALYVSHIHPTGVGPSGPPIAPMLDGIHLSPHNVTL